MEHARGQLGQDRRDTCCQIWMFGLASKFRGCQQSVGAFANMAGVKDVSTPLLGYNEERWDLGSEEWKAMERCTHDHAELADADVDEAWRTVS